MSAWHRYAQERALVAQMELAAEVGLPLVLYEVNAAEALADKVRGGAADVP